MDWTKVTIMPGVYIENGCIIGTNAVLAKNIPDYFIAVGNPAKVIKMHFDEETIRKLLEIKWWDLPISQIEKNIGLLQKQNISDLLLTIDIFPVKIIQCSI